MADGQNSGSQQVVQLLLAQLTENNQSIKELRTEVHGMSKTMQALVVNVQSMSKEQTVLDNRVNGVEHRLREIEKKLQHLEPIINISETVKGMIIKALAWGAVFMLVMYFARGADIGALLGIFK